jgi:hypothetical protein
LALAVVALLVAALGALSINAREASAASWGPAGSLSESRSHHTETKLAGGACNNASPPAYCGKVLVVGGQDGNAAGTATPITYRASVELYDPATQTWDSFASPTSCASPAPTVPSSSCPASLSQARAGHTATLLTTGKVLVVGGRGSGGYLASAELYDPATGEWTATGSLVQGHADHTATLLDGPPCEVLPDVRPAYCGKVLVAGGRNSAGSLPIAELYDPAAAGTWSVTGPLAQARADHTATRLDKPVPSDVNRAEINGMVLVAGGRTGTSVGTSGGAVLASAELYNPAAGAWVPAGPMTDLRSDHTATLLPGGRVLMAGGNIGEAGVRDPFLQGAAIITDSSDLYDPATNTHTPTQLLDQPRADHTATLLNGAGPCLLSYVGEVRPGPCYNVLAAGRIDGNGNAPGRTSEIYNYDRDDAPDINDYWRAGADMNAERANHTATKLDDGKVLVAGGVDGAGAPGSTVALSSAELYTP